MLKKTFIILAPFILLLGALSISLIPDFYRISITPPGKTYTMLHNHLTDYFYYLSLMHQGYEGKWLTTSRMTPEDFQPALAQTFFALLGNLARMLNISLPETYFISRIIFGIILMLSVIFLIRRIYENPKSRILAGFLVFFSTGFWTVSNHFGKLSIDQFLSFWTRMNPVLRTTYLPHHVLSTALGILSVVFLSDALKKEDFKKVILAGFCGFMAGFIYFASMINIFGGIIVSFAVFVLPKVITKNGGTVRLKVKPISIFFLYFFLCGLSFLYLWALTRTTFPWSSYTSPVGSFVFGLTIVSFAASLGPTFILTLLGIKQIASEEKWLPKLLLGWVVFPFIGIAVISRIYWRFADAYYLEAASYIPLGILAVYGIEFLREKILRHEFRDILFRVLSLAFPSRSIHLALGPLARATRSNMKVGETHVVKKKITAFVLLIILTAYFSVPIISSVRAEMQKNGPYYYNIYIPDEIMDGIKWLDNNTKKESVVLTGADFGSIIPAYTHNRVVYGHGSGTYNIREKRQDLILFFQQKKPIQAKEILQRYNVAYVFYTVDTDKPAKDFISVLPLESVFENNSVKIFKVTK